MSKDKPIPDNFELLSKYLSGNASDEDVRQLEGWVLSSPENKAQFKAFKKAWILSGIEQNSQQIDVEEEWAKTEKTLFAKGKVIDLPQKNTGRRIFMLRVAAAVALLAVAAIWLFRSSGNSTSIEVLAQNEILEQMLPDGSKVSLKQFATLEYDREMTGDIRRVKLKGDAFFEVARDTAHPFIISTQNVEVEVLGTSFYVDSRVDQNQIQVIVKSGSVAVKASGKQVVLKANETGIYDKQSAQLRKTENEDPNYLGWQENILVFEETSLEEVVFVLNRHFHASIIIENPALKNCPVTAVYKNKTLASVIRILEKSLNIKSRKNKDQIIFSGQVKCE